MVVVVGAEAKSTDLRRLLYAWAGLKTTSPGYGHYAVCKQFVEAKGEIVGLVQHC